jgi:ubiquinone/menaquinone biosynthesis C-methylase UbiE
MGEQIHIGGFASSMALADKAEIGAGMSGIDLCCCSGAGMRFLVRFRNVGQMTGVDFTEDMIERAKERCKEEEMCDRLQFKLADVMDTGLPAAKADFVWGEDAWCYVEDKARLIAEASRLVRQGGLIAFTDWIETSKGMSNAEAERFLRFVGKEWLSGQLC